MQNLDELTSRYKCAIYNELSHITPYYLTPDLKAPLHLEDELLFHKRNLFLLALTFDKIIICTDNIAAFTRFSTKDVVSRVVMSKWFTRFLEAGVIVLGGWGSDYGSDLMANQIAYSQLYRPELKEPEYLQHLRTIARTGDLVIREPSGGERDHITFLRDKVRYLEGGMTLDETAFLSDLIEETQENVGFVGTMEMFPFIDDIFLSAPAKADAFYRAYYKSWQEYCHAYYVPAVTVDTRRVALPARVARIAVADREVRILSALYSPEVFYQFLCRQFGYKVAVRILDLEPDQLLTIRNGDWKIFLEKYHGSLATASEAAWIIDKARQLDLLGDEKRIDEILDHIFTALDPGTDLSSIGNILDVALRAVIGVSFLGPIFTMFRGRVNQRLSKFISSLANKELEPFLRKLSAILVGPVLQASIIQ